MPGASRRSQRHSVGRALALIAIALLQAAYAVACVDGQTPDCSDAATQCGPNLDGSSSDGSRDGDAPFEATADASPNVDADAAADADASDGD
jgi:hypothetical protein